VQQVSGVAPPIIMTLQNFLPGDELVRDIYFRFTYRRNLGWKHSSVSRATNLTSYRRFKDEIAFVTITKNPYSWLLSLFRNPYHNHGIEKMDFEKFLESPWKTVGRDNVNQILDSPIDLWNIKNRSYLQLDKASSLNITTESIIKDADQVISQISQKFSISKKSDKFINYSMSTKGETKNSDYYRDYYLNERWRGKLTRKSICIINNKIDADLMSHYGYDLL
jgi:hypothetical protein